MRTAPRWLPSATSRKWHGRRHWDSLGYVRVRSLANPQWPRDPDWLIRIIRNKRPRQPGPERDAIDDTLHLLRDYRAAAGRAEAGDERSEQSEALWDAALDALDRYLRIHQEEHQRAVDEAGRSARI